MVGDSSGNTMVQNRRIGPAPSIAAASITLLRDRLQAGQEEQEVVGDLLPHRGHHHQGHGVVAVEQRIPVNAHRAQRPRQRAERGMEHEDPEHAGDRGRHRIGPDQQRLVGAGGLQVLVGLGRKQQRDRERQRRDQRREHQRRQHRRVIFGLARTASGSFQDRRIRTSGRTRPRAGRIARPPGSPANRRRRT